ncbi:anti-phage dCTP deaminase [Pseudomonas sp. F(2018)]|uniref:anti-phage dCTP deaminase n=1 Tax=Pseudomonas sp. F(2018) TaxID=2502240 RepID=UPI0010F86CA0|nr:anti-phage dCTP deaminase [Pseudomonas sp. F(2018)]
MSSHTNAPDCELVIGLVAPVGVNLEDVNTRLNSFFTQFRYGYNPIQVSELGKRFSDEAPQISCEIQRLDFAMNTGKMLREKSGRGDFYALLAINAINELRENSEPLKRHAHVIRSLKHPDEVATLRRVYGDGFFLLGISSSIASRKYYLKELKGVPEDQIDRLIARDDKEPGDFGQRTRDVFQMADAFVTTDDTERLSFQLSRILDLLFSKPVVPPTQDEYAMFMAYAASLRSADLSRQVGAVIANNHNDIVATGANDVPKFGGGLYWPTENDQRDYIKKEDSNEKEKQKIILGVMRKITSDPNKQEDELIQDGLTLLKDTGLLNITEYGRAVHAEMEAILSAARNGLAIRGSTLYTTTYPCHNCAKHIVAAGIGKVKYVEPYPKSYAIKLHGDSIESYGEDDESKVKFEPFVGIGPRRFVDLFSMSLSSGRIIERKKDGDLMEWDRSTAELRVPMIPLSYLDAELHQVNLLNTVVSASGMEESR